MLITFTGWKSGQEYTIPVNYFLTEEGDHEILLTTSKRERTWWRNLRDGAKVHLLIGGKSLLATARAIEDPQEVIKGLSEILESAPGIAKYFDVSLDPSGKPDLEDVTRAAEPLVIVRSLIPYLFSTIQLAGKIRNTQPSSNQQDCFKRAGLDAFRAAHTHGRERIRHFVRPFLAEDLLRAGQNRQADSIPTFFGQALAVIHHRHLFWHPVL
jgi:hypothetical protein